MFWLYLNWLLLKVIKYIKVISKVFFGVLNLIYNIYWKFICIFSFEEI